MFSTGTTCTTLLSVFSRFIGKGAMDFQIGDFFQERPDLGFFIDENASMTYF